MSPTRGFKNVFINALKRKSISQKYHVKAGEGNRDSHGNRLLKKPPVSAARSFSV